MTAKRERPPGKGTYWVGIGSLVALLGVGAALVMAGWKEPDIFRDLGVGLLAAAPVALVVILLELAMAAQAQHEADERDRLVEESRLATGNVIVDAVARFLASCCW